MVNIEEQFLSEILLSDDFNYKDLYNDGARGAIFKDQYKSLIKQAIEKKVIVVKKFIVAENVQEELYKIVEEKGSLKTTLVNYLKDYASESDFLIAPFILLLRKLDPKFTVVIDESESRLLIKSKYEIRIRQRIDGANATPRIYLPNEKVSFSSSNDSVENLGDILSVKDTDVYVIDSEERSNRIVAYKILRNNKFFEVANSGFRTKVVSELFRDVKI